jgi:hypothetical protein
MSDDATIPTTQAKLMPTVLWAVGVLHGERGYVGVIDIAAYVANKFAVDPQQALGVVEERAIRRVLNRLIADFLVEFDTESGYRLGPEND